MSAILLPRPTPSRSSRAEDRERFQQMLYRLELRQPSNAIVRSTEEAVRMAVDVGYPLVVRPSYVLCGRAMEIVYKEEELRTYMREAVQVSEDAPVLLDHFLNNAIEVDIDAVSDGQEVVIGAIMQHIEQCGVHSGDSACSLPPYSLPADVQDEMRRVAQADGERTGTGSVRDSSAYRTRQMKYLEGRKGLQVEGRVKHRYRVPILLRPSPPQTALHHHHGRSGRG